MRQGFDPHSHDPPSALDVERTRQDTHNIRPFLGRIAGEPAGGASYMRPIDNVTEIAGIATRKPFRRLGVAAALTAYATGRAFGEGVNLDCLTAGDIRA